MKGWHVTSSRNRGGIEAEGLLLPDWGTRAIWFFVDRDIALQAAEVGRWTPRGMPVDVWEIDLDGMLVAPDPHEGWGSSRPGWDDAARIVREAVPTSRLRILDSLASPVV